MNADYGAKPITCPKPVLRRCVWSSYALEPVINLIFSGQGITLLITGVFDVAGELDVASVFDLASVFAVAGVLCRICCLAMSFLSSRISRKSSCALTMSHFID